eukprot:403331911
MGTEVAAIIKGKSWDEQYDWVQSQKEEGNKLYKVEVFDQAIDAYMKALCGLDFGKDQTEDQVDRVSKDLKAPILNNIAMCLIKQGKFQRSNQMLDQVLACDEDNFKAWTRKVQNHIRMGETEQAKKSVQKFEKLASSLEDKALITSLYKEIAQQTMKEKNFSQNIFGNSRNGLYQDKPDYSKMEEYMQQYENDHLATLSNTQWFLYPFKKTLRAMCRKIGFCRKGNDFGIKDEDDKDE